MNRIFGLKHGDLQKIANKLGCSRVLVSMAIKGAVDSDLGKAARKEALQMGGFVLPPKMAKRYEELHG